MLQKSILKLCVMAIVIALVAGCEIRPTAGAYLRVDEARCSACNRCSSVCNSDAIRIINGKAVIDPTKCVECGKCVQLCPSNAIY